VKLTQGTGRGICRWNNFFFKNVYYLLILNFWEIFINLHDFLIYNHDSSDCSKQELIYTHLQEHKKNVYFDDLINNINKAIIIAVKK